MPSCGVTIPSFRAWFCFLGQLRPGQSAGRHQLHLPRSADPILMTVMPYEDERLATAVRVGALRDLLRRHPTAVVGGVLLFAHRRDRDLCALSRDHRPAGASPVRRLRPPNAENWFGTDTARPRHLQPRAVRGAHLADRRLQCRYAQHRHRPFHRPGRRVQPRRRCRRDAHHGRSDGNSADPCSRSR